MLNEDLNDPSAVENTSGQPGLMDKLLNFLSAEEDEDDALSEAEAEEEFRQRGIQPLAVRQKVKDILFAPPQVPVLVIQPFATLNTEYDGQILLDIADQVSLRLSRYRQVIVRPPSSVRALSDDFQDPVKLGRKLGADFILTGNILGEGGKLSVVTRFNRVRDGAELWEGKYESTVERIFEVEDLITDRVIRRLDLRLAQAEPGRLAKNHSENSTAYHKYRLGHFHLNQQTKASLEKAASLFEEAIRLDPWFAPAHAALADCRIMQGVYNIAPPMEKFERGFVHAQDALWRNTELVEAHTSKAYAYMCYGWNWEAAESSFKDAIELNPNYARAHLGYAHLLGALGRFSEAIVEIDRAITLDPTSAFARNVRGFILYYDRRYEESMQQFYSARNVDPHSDVTYYGLALACEQLALACLERGAVQEAGKKFDEAKWAARKAVKLSRNNSQKRALQAHIYVMRNDQDDAFNELSQLEALCAKEYVSPFHMGAIYAAQGKIDKAIKCLKKAYRLRDQWLVLLNVDPRFASLHHDRRFKRLIRKLNFPSVSRPPKKVSLMIRVVLPAVLVSCLMLSMASVLVGLTKGSLIMTFAMMLYTATMGLVITEFQKFLRSYNLTLPTIRISVNRSCQRWWQHCYRICGSKTLAK
jgi:tetratricopeptide (TPR) repeat protein